MERRALVLVAALMAGCGGGEEAPKESAAEKLARDGRALLAQGDQKAAVAHFKRAVEEGEGEPHGRLGLALAAVLEGNTPAAQEQLVALRAKGIEPADSAPWLTALLDARKHVPPPIRTVRESETPEPAPALVVDAAAAAEPPSAADEELSALFRAGKYTDVLAKVEAVTEPTVFQLKLAADSHYNLQQWRQAVADYRQVLRREPGNEPVTQYLADALFRLGRHDEAIAFYRVLAEANPDRPGFWRLIGDAALAKQDNEVALAAYTRALDGGYDDPNVATLVEDLRSKVAAKR